MVKEVELSSFDIRFQSHRLFSNSLEKQLLCSIASKGIHTPLFGVDIKETPVLLDGFKRYRCARKLHIPIVPYESFGTDEAEGILRLIYQSTTRSLTIVEQARFIDELNSVYGMRVSDIAMRLEKSKSWVSVRKGLVDTMSNLVKEKIFSGAFPMYSYMYTLRPFIRINKIPYHKIDEFVQLVSGKNLSIRDIDLLASGFFKGGEDIARQIRRGNIEWGLRRLRKFCFDKKTNECNKLERSVLRDFEIILNYMQRLTNKSIYNQLKHKEFFAQATIIVGGILRHLPDFTQTIKEFYDQSRETKSDL